MKQVSKQPVSESPLQSLAIFSFDMFFFVGGGILKQRWLGTCFRIPPPVCWRGNSETGCFGTCFIIHPPCVEPFLVEGEL